MNSLSEEYVLKVLLSGLSIPRYVSENMNINSIMHDIENVCIQEILTKCGNYPYHKNNSSKKRFCNKLFEAISIGASFLILDKTSEPRITALCYL